MSSARDRLGDLEDNFTERKPAGVNRADFRRTLVGFANSVPEGRTAILFVGVSDEGAVVGVPNPDSLQKTVRSVAEDDCYPPIRITSEVLTLGQAHVVAVSVPHSPEKPHFAGPAYVRRGSETIVASAEIYEELITSRHSEAGVLVRLRGQVVTVLAIAKLLGSTKYLGDRAYRERHDCRIEACTPQFVRLYDISTQKTLTEPLENVTLSFDDERNRPLLVVKTP